MKIADFGIAKMVTDPSDRTDLTDLKTSHGQGTPDYAAPEQQNGTADHRADIYSLGVVLYEMLTGERPNQNITPPSKRVQVDIRIDEIVLRALEKTPELRFQTAADFRTQVEAAVSPRAGSQLPRVLESAQGFLFGPTQFATQQGRFFAFRHRGQLMLDDQRLVYSRGGVKTIIPLDSIRDLSIGQYPRSVSPLSCDLISLTYQDGSALKQVLISPMEGWVGLPSMRNAFCAQWFVAIQEAVIEATGKAPGTTPPDQLQIAQGSACAHYAMIALPIVATALAVALILWRRPGIRPDLWGIIPAVILVMLAPLAFRWLFRRPAAKPLPPVVSTMVGESDINPAPEPIGDAAAAIPDASQFEYITSWGVRITPGPAVKTGYTRFWEHLFGSVESTGAIHTLNLSRLGFGGFGVFLVIFSGMRWMWPVFGAFGMFGLIGIAFISEAAARCGVDLSKNDGSDDAKAARVVWRRRIFWSIVVGGILPIAFFALSFIFALTNGGEKAIEAATTEQMLMILVKVFGTGVGFAFSAWALLRVFWKKPAQGADLWPRYPEALVAVASFGPSMLIATPFFIWEFVSATRAQAALLRMSGDFAHRDIGEWILLVLTVLMVLQGAVWITRNLRQTLRVMNGEGNGSAPEPQVESATPNAEDDYTPEPVSAFDYAWRVVPILAIILALFNPWGRDAWMWFGFGCAVLALAPPLFDRTPKLSRRRSETKQKQSRWQGWDVWVIGLCLVVFGALSLLQLSEGPLLNRSLFAGAGVGSNVVLPVALATTILLAGAAFLYMLARNIKAPSATRTDSWKRTLGRSIVPAIAVALLLRTFIVAPFWSVTDSSAPEIPRGSLVLVWKLSRTFAEGELIAYAENGRINIGRIAKPSQEAVFVKRNNSEPTSVLHSAIVGKVVSVIWRGTVREPKAGGISKVQTEAQKTTIDAEVDAGQELLVFIGDGTQGWSFSQPGAAAVTATVEPSSELRLDDGSLGKGFIIRTSGGVAYVAITPGGAIPFGEFMLRPASALSSKNGIYTVADIHQSDGTRVPVSVRIRAKKVPQPSAQGAINNEAPIRSGPVFPYTISGRTTGGKPLEVGGLADVIVTIHGGGPRHSEVLPIVRGAKVTKITDNDPSISNDRLVELELTQAEVDLTKLHAYRHSFYFARVDAPLESDERPKPGNMPNVPTTAGAVDSQLSEKPAVKLIRIEERGKTRDGRDMVMIFEELQRDEKTSIVTIKAVNGGSVGSAMFMVQGASDIAKARSAACFINLKEWEGKDGAWMYLIGFAPDKGVDPTTYFELKEPLPAEKRHQFLSVKDYEPLFNRQP